MSDFGVFGFGQGDARMGRKSKRLKLTKGQTVRLGFIWWPGLDKGDPNLTAQTPNFVGGPRHYMKGVGYFLNKGPEYTKIAGEAPKTRIATIVVSWPLKAGGKIDTDALQAAMKKAAGDPEFSSAKEIDIYGWTIDQQKYDAIRPIHGEWHLGSHDITVSCLDEQFQKMSFSPCKDSVFKSLVDKSGKDSPLVKYIVNEALAVSTNIRDDIGRDMTVEQIREKLAGGGGNSNFGAVTGIGSPVGGNDQIDSALDDLLS